MQVFEPKRMEYPHRHGHIEANFANDFGMEYNVNGRACTVPANRLVLFRAGIPHRLVDIRPRTENTPKLCNLYLPLDSFRMMQSHYTDADRAAGGRDDLTVR